MKTLNGASALTTLFVAFYNYLRPQGGLNHSSLSRDELRGAERYRKLWETLFCMAAEQFDAE